MHFQKPSKLKYKELGKPPFFFEKLFDNETT